MIRPILNVIYIIILLYLCLYWGRIIIGDYYVWYFYWSDLSVFDNSSILMKKVIIMYGHAKL